MGLLKDAYNLGAISASECKDISEEWANNEEENYYGLGWNARHSGDVEAFQTMTEELSALGLGDLANEAFAMYQDSINHYSGVYEGQITYDSNLRHWRSTVNGQFVGDPYTWIRD